MGGVRDDQHRVDGRMPPHPKRILIVDDFGQMRSTLKQMLFAIGFEEIDVASNGKDALSALRRSAYDIVLCDYNLGEGKDGQQVLEEAKFYNYLRPSSIFVMITAENTSDMVMGAMEYRPDDYLTKPFTKELLRTRLDRLMTRKRELESIDGAVHKGDLPRAIALCEEKIAEQPRHVGELLRLKASLCMRVGDYAKAEAVYQEVLAIRQLPWAQVGLAEVRRSQQRLQEAREILLSVIEHTPTYMEAHDLLARTLDELGEGQEAQRVLEEAARISPKSVRRQHALGDLAMRNADLDTAERAFRRTIALGRLSVYKDPGHYTGLAQVQAKNGSLVDALRTLGSVRNEFAGNDQANLKAVVAEGLLLSDAGREEEARKAVADARQLFAGIEGKVNADTALELAKVQLLTGDREAGMQLMQDLVRNHHEDSRLLAKAQEAFSAAGLEEEGREVIRRTTGEVVKLNNSGVTLVKEGKIVEALALFEEAIASMPNNKTLYLNAAQALLLHLQRQGVERERLEQARRYLERVKAMEPDNPTLQKMLPVYRRLASGAGTA